MDASILDERQISLTALAREQDVNCATVWRWSTKGIRGVRLETLLIGGKRMTSHEAFRRFVAATTAASGISPAPTVRTPAARQRAIDNAKQALAKAGI